MKTSLKILSLIVLTLGLSISSVHAVDSTDTSKNTISAEQLAKYTVQQNLENLNVNIEDYYAQSLYNLIFVYENVANETQKNEISEIVFYQSKNAPTATLRYKAYLTFITLQDETYREWVKDYQVRSASADDFFNSLAVKVNSNLIGSPLTEGFINQ